MDNITDVLYQRERDFESPKATFELLLVFYWPVHATKIPRGSHGEKKLLLCLTIDSYVSVRSSRYEARGKFGEHERYVRVARGVAESNSSFLSAFQTSQFPRSVFITLSTRWKIFFLEGFVCWRHNKNMKHARAIEFE